MNRLLILTVLLIGLSFSSYSQTGTIEVVISGIRQVQGSILASIFNAEEGFPEDSGKSFISKTVEVTGESQTLFFRDIPIGKYAIAVVHDQNNNGIFDKNFLGIPREGYAVSNNIKGLSAPKFSETSFELDSKEKVLKLNLIFF